MTKEKIAKRNDRIVQAQSELEASRQWMENIPTDADPLEIAQHQIVVQFWPMRIQAISDERKRNHV